MSRSDEQLPLPVGGKYPYHPEVWKEIRDLSEAALDVVDLEYDEKDANDTFIVSRWRVNRLGFACRLERPLIVPSEETVYNFGFEDDASGRHFGRLPYISAGLRQPVARKPRNYGILGYSQARGLLGEPEGILSSNYIKHSKDVGDPTDPEERIHGFEKMLKDLLGYAPRGWEAPLR